MNITILNRDPNAPFDLYEENKKSNLINTDLPNKLKDLAWENLDIKTYCLGIKTQLPIQLEKLENLAKYQEQARATADLYLRDHAIKINNVYTQTNLFVNNFETRFDTLCSFAGNIENNTTGFENQIQELINSITQISDACTKLTSVLPPLRAYLERDSRNFQQLTKDANTLITTNKFNIKQLEKKVTTLTAEIARLNKEIAGYASTAGIGFFGIIIAAVVGSLVILGTLGAGTPAVVAGGIGLATSGALVGVGATKAADAVREKNKKMDELLSTNNQLGALNGEVTIASNLIEQFNPWIEKLRACPEQIQALYEAWDAIKNNFRTINHLIISSKFKRSEELTTCLTNTKKTVNNIKTALESHKTQGLISSKVIIEESVARAMNLPRYFHDPITNLITVPTDLWLAAVKKHQSLMK